MTPSLNFAVRAPLLRALSLAAALLALGCGRTAPPPADSGIPDINLAGVEKTIDAELFRAASGVDTDAVESSIDDGADVNARNNLGRTPLFAAAFHGRTEVASLLLEKGASVMAQDGSGFTPLHAAVLGGSPGLADLLAKAGADVDARSAAGMTPLHLAAATGQIDVARVLLAAGADKAIRDRQGETPVGLAEANHHPATLALIQKAKRPSPPAEAPTEVEPPR